ncbi:hypothetical protein [Usitatibacter palustris]|uniref:YXWGXW repeat-containing protein n=1 Tax=Usitatibacter palustris TaxID=2732487 RepID=A0A6M4H8B6_9PROT|nr:hypothetical protein [Usitatibacter palustris]QJR14953.1 hypothetical protein DSM104440_01768 [Usitatibacter palustris]
MRAVIVALGLSFCALTPASAQLSVQIGINLPSYPQLVAVPGHPVYYAPQVHSNYFFYDGAYWVYERDNWYSSAWYNGPWGRVGPEAVPLYILRVPVRYYRHAPAYFSGWRRDAAPRWGEHWGPDWQRNRSGWNQWDRSSAPARAPLPSYQRQYAGNRYPQSEQQYEIRDRSYKYKSRDPDVQSHYRDSRGQQGQDHGRDNDRDREHGSQGKGHGKGG